MLTFFKKNITTQNHRSNLLFVFDLAFVSLSQSSNNTVSMYIFLLKTIYYCWTKKKSIDWNRSNKLLVFLYCLSIFTILHACTLILLFTWQFTLTSYVIIFFAVIIMKKVCSLLIWLDKLQQIFPCLVSQYNILQTRKWILINCKA